MKLTISDKLRRDIKKVGKRYMEGESLSSIGEDYGCGYKLVERIMKQMLPVEFFTEKKRREIEAEKKKLTGKQERGHGAPRVAMAA